MFNELAFIDWIALAFAAVLLAGAAAAAVLAYATSRARTSEPRSGYAHAATTSTTAREPAHAGASTTAGAAESADHQPIHAAVGKPRHVVEPILGRASVASSDGERESIPLSASSSADDNADVIVLNGPASDHGIEATADDLDDVEGEVIDLRSTMPAPAVEEIDESELTSKLADRAARLRGRRPEVDQPTEAHVAPVDEVVPSQVASAAPQAEAGPAPRAGFSARVPGFFEDPMGRHELRYWDGNRWTEYVKERGERFTDPL